MYGRTHRPASFLLQKAEKENTIVASSKASTALDKQKPKLTSVASTGALRALPTQPMTQN